MVMGPEEIRERNLRSLYRYREILTKYEVIYDFIHQTFVSELILPSLSGLRGSVHVFIDQEDWKHTAVVGNLHVVT